jgi:hypothetical protein
MKLKPALLLILVLATALAPAGRQAAVLQSPDTYLNVLKTFQDPPAEFRSAPLWVWNDRMTKTEIEEQLADFKARGIGGVFVHPRPGLITPYLSDEWLALFKHAVATGKTLGLKVWIYDENSYPSGFAGGHVPAQMPDAVRTGLRGTKAGELPESFAVAPLVVLRKTASGYDDITAEARAKGKSLGAGDYYIFDLNPQKPNPWYGGFTYVDLMRRDVTEKFLDVTLNAYRKAFGDEFGGVVPGVFQDEAEISPAGGQGMTVVNYTPALFTKFKERWGYDLRTSLPSLFDDVGDFRRVRHDYYALLLDLFIDGWAVPYYEYCVRNKLAFTGHYWEHEWPRPTVNPDNMAFAAYSHMPGIDILMNDFQTDTHAQFGNARAVKEIRSAANQTGRQRTMSETYGAGGWDLTFSDQKRIADWEFALGVNFINQHLSYVTVMGARKRDHPQSFSYHEPWWGSYRMMGDYLGRLSTVMSLGRQDNKILVLEPTTTGWLYHSPRGETDKIKSLGKDFQDFVNSLEAAQIEYDLGSEHTLRNLGKAREGRLVVGERTYDVVVLPPGMENVEDATAVLLGDYAGQGGKILSWIGAPPIVGGKSDARLVKVAASQPLTWLQAKPETWRADLLRLSGASFVVEPGRPKGTEPVYLFHHRRTLKDAELVFLANSSAKASASGSIVSPAQSGESWDAVTGKTAPYPVTIKDGKPRIEFEIPPGGSLLLCLRPAGAPAANASPSRESALASEKGPAVKRESPYVLTLDYCDLTLDGKTETDLFFYDAQLKTFRRHGLDRNPWDSAVQYKTNILDKDHFAADSGFEATFRFPVAEGVRAESRRGGGARPRLFPVSGNRRAVAPIPGQWWLDKAFGVFDIGPYVKPGENAIILKSAPFTIHSELEAVYILGDFALAGADKGFRIVPAAPLKLGAWTDQSLPLYSGAVSYTKTYNLRTRDFRKTRYDVELGAWKGSVVDVRVNGKPAGSIAFEPYRLDITGLLTLGSNDVSVLVTGTLKNTLGPFHNEPQLGRAWPGSFQQGAKGGRPAGAKYSVVGYGLFEDFKLVPVKIPGD